MSKNAVKRVAPGYLLLKPYELKRKVGAFAVAAEEDETAPELGTIIQVGEIPLAEQIKIDKLASSNAKIDTGLLIERQYPWKEGMIVGYKKYNHFKFPLGATDQLLVAFDNVLFELEATDE
jgi:hypothetical protein